MNDLTARQQDWLRGAWILTYTGRQFYPTVPDVLDVDARDIAHALSLQCRYNGHTKRFYSVAEHCVLLSYSVDREHALWALLHDAAEAYIGDMVRPLKQSMPEYCAIDDELTAVIAQAFGLSAPHRIPDAVRTADARILLDERAALLDNSAGHLWSESIEQLTPLGVQVDGWSPDLAEHLYEARLEELLSELQS